MKLSSEILQNSPYYLNVLDKQTQMVVIFSFQVTLEKFGGCQY